MMYVSCGIDCSLLTGSACIQEVHLVSASAPMKIFTVSDAKCVFLIVKLAELHIGRQSVHTCVGCTIVCASLHMKECPLCEV